MVYPLWYIIVGSFNEGQDLMRGGIYFFPRSFTLDNYKAVFYDNAIVTALLVTVAKSAAGCISQRRTYNMGILKSAFCGKRCWTLPLSIVLQYF